MAAQPSTLERDLVERTLEGNDLTRRAVALLTQFTISNEHSLESYNLFVERAVKLISESQLVVEINGRIYRYWFTMPTLATNLTVDNITSLPHKLPIKLLTRGDYTLHFKMEFIEDVWANDQWQTAHRKNMMVGVPLMLGSKYDPLNYGVSPEERVERSGLSGLDPLGYFIIGGTVHGIVQPDKLRANKAMTYFDSGLKRVATKLTSETPSGTMVISVMVGSINKYTAIRPTATIQYIIDHSIDVQTQMMYLGKISVPFPVLFYLLQQTEPGLAVDESILDSVLNYIKPEHQHRARYAMFNSFIHASAEIARHGGLEKLMMSLQYDDGRKEPEREPSRVRDRLINELFPHYPKEDVSGKLEMLSKMVAQTVEYLIGVRTLDNRDDWYNKRTVTAGKLVEQLFRRTWNNFLLALKDVAKESRVYDRATELLRQKVETPVRTSFTPGKWLVGKITQTITEYPKPQGPTEMRAIATKIRTPASSKGTNLSPREVRASQWGYICPIKTPEGARCGVVKFLASTCHISMGRQEDRDQFDVWLEELSGEHPEIYLSFAQPVQAEPTLELNEISTVHPTGVVRLTERRPKLPNHDTHLIVDGVVRGWCHRESLRRLVVAVRRQGLISPEVCAAYDDQNLYLHTDAGRNIRPLLVVNMRTRELVIAEKNLWTAPKETLFREGAVEYLDVWEQDMPHVVIAPSLIDFYQSRLDLQAAAQEYQSAKWRLVAVESTRNSTDQSTEQSQAEARVELQRAKRQLEWLIKTKTYSYVELHPAAILSITAAMIPLLNHNQGPRNTYQSNMADQALARPMENYSYDFQKTSRWLIYPETPLFASDVFMQAGYGLNPTGANVIVAFLAMDYNQEDAIIVNKRSLDLGLFHNYKVITIVLELAENEFFGMPESIDYKEEDYAHIDRKTGFPRLGTYIRPGQVIAARYRRQGDRHLPHPFRTTPSQNGIVEAIYNTSQSGRGQKVLIRLRDYRVPECGDKLAPRCAQKGTIGRVMPYEDMPVLQSIGRPPDIIINPHAIPSRMTLAFILELVASKVAALRGEFIHATPWEKVSMAELERLMTAYGFQRQGNDVAYNGETGKPMTVAVFWGVAYYQLLKHMARDKYQARGGGPHLKRDNLKQPPKGRKHGGGLRFGEMEVSGSLAHGAANFVWDRLCGSSDKFKIVICNNCGELAETNILNLEQPNRCPNCSDLPGVQPEFLTVEIPYVLIYLKRTLQVAGINIRFRAKTIDEYNRQLINQQQLLKQGIMIASRRKVVSDLDEDELEDGSDEEGAEDLDDGEYEEI